MCWSTVVAKRSAGIDQVDVVVRKWGASVTAGILLMEDGTAWYATGRSQMSRVLRSYGPGWMVILLLGLPGAATLPWERRRALTRAGYVLGSRGGGSTCSQDDPG